MSVASGTTEHVVVHRSTKSYPPDASNHTMSPLAALLPEILVQVLLLGCGTYLGYREHFLNNRGTFSLVCRRWRTIIVSCGSFWSSYVFRPLRRRSTFELWTSRFNGHSLELIVELDRHLLWTDASLDELTVDETINSLISFLPSCRKLIIEAADIIPLTRLTGIMSTISMPNLRYLALISEPVNSLAAMSHAYQPTHLSIPTPYAPAFIPMEIGPSFIRLSGLVLTWTHHMYYANVTTLILQYFSVLDAPAIEQLHAVLGAAKLIRRLSMNGIYCEPSTLDLSDLLLPRLEELQLRMGGNGPVGRLVSSIIAPKLQILHLFIDGVPDMTVLTGCAPLLRGVETLVVDGEQCGRSSIVQLFKLMPRVLECDMSMSSCTFFGALKSGGPTVFPLLRSLVLTDRHFAELKQFVVSRASGVTPLDKLHVRYMFSNGMDEDERNWMDKHVTYFDPEPVWQRYWYHLT
ncbi:hypothetical protein C8R47DRAFT_1225493 [Mycena vitilis]|nr:hypothetical protein C8R47DRAFT_1225493 [Mycena vitilis]